MGLFDKLQDLIDKRQDRQLEFANALADWALKRGKTIPSDEHQDAAIEAAAHEFWFALGSRRCRRSRQRYRAPETTTPAGTTGMLRRSSTGQ